MSNGPVEEPSPSAGDIAPARPRMGLRQAFGLSAVAEPTRGGGDGGAAGLARAVVAGATRALLGRAATGLELALAERAMGLGDLSPDRLAEQVISDLLALPEAVAWLSGSAGLVDAGLVDAGRVDAGRVDQGAGMSVPDAPPARGRLDDDVVFSAIANGIFQALLNRPAGEEGVRIFRESMFQDYLDTDLDAFICRFVLMVVRSPEWMQRFIADQQRLVRLSYMPRRGMEQTSHISLGASGYTAGMLRRFGLRRWSGPFDWLSATPAMIREIIADDFRSFLDPDAWEAIGPEDRPDGRYFQCRHRRYEARHREACILHAADMTQEDGLAYMDRCVTRFRQSLHGLANKIVLQVAPEGDDPEREFRATADVLDGYGRSFQFVMVSVLPDHGAGPFPEIDPALAHGRHRLLRVRLLAPIIGIEASDMLDDLVLLRASLAAPSIGT